MARGAITVHDVAHASHVPVSVGMKMAYELRFPGGLGCEAHGHNLLVLAIEFGRIGPAMRLLVLNLRGQWG